MLRIYDNVITMMPTQRRVLDAIERRDGDLARQGRKALHSVALNLGEGSYRQGRNRRAKYHLAMGSMREVMCVTEVAVAMGYIDRVDAGLVDGMNHVMAVLVRVVKPTS